MKRIFPVYPESDNFLDSEAIEYFSRHSSVDPSALTNEYIVIKSMPHSKEISDVTQFLN